MTKAELKDALADWEVFEQRLAELNQDLLGDMDMLVPAPVMLPPLRTLAEAARLYLEENEYRLWN